MVIVGITMATNPWRGETTTGASKNRSHGHPSEAITCPGLAKNAQPNGDNGGRANRGKCLSSGHDPLLQWLIDL